MAEEWRDIKGYEGLYQVSNLGRVRSVERIVPRGSGTMKVREKILKQSTDNYGYKFLNLRKAGKNGVIRVHRLVAESFLPHEKRQEQFIVDHIDGDKTNNCASNLRYCTPKENHQYAVELGLIDPNLIADYCREKPQGEKPVIRSDGKVFRSAREADRAMGIAYGGVAHAASGQHKTCQGYSFKYIEQAS